MKTLSFSFFILSLYVVFLHSPFTFAQDSLAITIPYDQSLKLAKDTSQFYTIDLTAIPQGVDVSLSALSLNTGPKMYVSKNEANQRPMSVDTSDYLSVSYGSNIIFISAKDLVGVRHLYVGLICKASNCESELSFEYSKEIFVTADGTPIIETSETLNQASSAIIRLAVPEVKDAERIVIHVNAIPTSAHQSPSELSVFIKVGNEIPFTNHAENIPRSSWFEGRTIVIYNDTDNFCTNCNYTLSIKFDRFSSISFQADVFEADMRLEGNAILDGSKPEYFNSYLFQLEESRRDKDFVIDIKPQESRQRLYINCDLKPPGFESYYWSYDVTSSMEITLTAKEHNKYCKTGMYYLLVTSNEPSVYSIKVATKDTSRLFVGKDSPVKGDIFPNETISYEIFLPLFMAEKLKIELSTQNHISMSLLNCRFPTDCPNLLPAGIEFRHQITNDTTYQPPEFQYDLKEENNLVTVSLDPHAEGCYPIIIEDEDYMQDAVPVCAYKITLFNENKLPSEYTLKAQPEGHEWLFAGVAEFESIAKDDVTYYVLYVPQEDITQVNIQLTKFSGDLDIFVSKKEKYPNSTTDETEFAHEGMISFSNRPDLNGTYYIAIQGVETSSYSIVATVMTQNGKMEDYAQKLDLGLPQKGVLLPNHEHPSRFYKFDLNLEQDWQGSINIAINTLRGSVLIAVNNNEEIPMPNDHMWRSINQEIEISSTDPNFSPNGTYYIGVFVDWEVRQPEFDDITFTIIYFLREATAGTDTSTSGASNREHLFLSPLTPFYRSIKSGEVDYYEAFVLPRDEKITVYKQADAGDIDLYVSLDQQNEYPSEDRYNYSTRITHRDSIELTSEDLSLTCLQAGSKLCTFYIAVIPKAGQDKVSYTLTMKRDYGQKDSSQITPLEDGRQAQQHVPANGSMAYFYFYAVPFYPSVITVSCPGVEITILALEQTVELGSSHKPDIQVPKYDSYNYTSANNGMSSLGLAHLTIPEENFMSTKVISLAVNFKSTDKSGSSVPTSTIFTILASSRMTHIYTGKPYYGAVEAGKYMYFTLDVAKPSCTLLISLTTLNDGDPDLVVSTQTTSENLPTLASHQFASISAQKTEVLEINELDIYPKTSMEGTWVIGVYGMDNSTFVLTVMDEYEKMVQLKEDVPFEMYLKEDSTMYFKHYHFNTNKSNIEIRINQLSGDTTVYVTSVLEDNDIFTNLPNKTNAKWTFQPAENPVLSIPATDPLACTDCLYLIALESSTYSKISIVISEASTFTPIQGGTPYIDLLTPGASKVYLFTSTTAEEITLSVVLRGPEVRMFASHSPEVSADNNLWYGTLTASHPSKILSLVRSELEHQPGQNVRSQKNSFYIRFDNPTTSDISYTFTVTSKDTSPIIKSGSKFMTTLGHDEAISLIYYSSEDDEVVKLDLAFSVAIDSWKISEQAFEKVWKKGIPVTANYWGEKVTTGLGKEIPVVKDDVMRDRTETSGSIVTYHFREGFEVESKRGKFSFDIENPFMSNITLSATVYSSEFGTMTLDQNTQHSSRLTPDMSETYEFYLGNQGAWYLWVYACSGDLQFSTDSNPDQLSKGGVKVQNIKSSEGYLHELKVNNAPMQYARFESSKPAQYILASNFFFEQKHLTYQLQAPVPNIKSSFEYHPMNNKVLVNFEPLKLGDYEATDEIIYNVKVCPLVDKDQDSPANLCIIKEDCRLSQKKFRMNDQAHVEAVFDRMPVGKFYIHVTADIQHNSQFIKFIPYPKGEIEVYKPLTEHVSNNLGKVVLALVGLLIIGVLTFIFCGRLKKAGHRGFELADIGRRRGYGFVGDEQDTSQQS